MASDRDSWEIYDESVPFAGAIYGKQRVRMAAIGIGSGGLLVVSPGTGMGEAVWQQVASLGTPRFLLAPNAYHNGGIATWKQRYPDVRVVAHSKAIPRLRKQVPGVEFEELSALESALPPGVRLLVPPQAKQGETGVSVKLKDGVGWYLVDNIMNEERIPGGGVGFVMKIVGFRAGLMTNPFFKLLFLKDKRGYKEWLYSELERDRPTLFVPSHGKSIRGADVTDQLRAATEAA